MTGPVRIKPSLVRKKSGSSGPVRKTPGPVRKKPGPVRIKPDPVRKKTDPVWKKPGPVSQKTGPFVFAYKNTYYEAIFDLLPNKKNLC